MQFINCNVTFSSEINALNCSILSRNPITTFISSKHSESFQYDSKLIEFQDHIIFHFILLLSIITYIHSLLDKFIDNCISRNVLGLITLFCIKLLLLLLNSQFLEQSS